MTVAELELAYPSVPWREPVRITRTDGEWGYACRVCIAVCGFKASEIPSLPRDVAEAERHVREAHP